MMIRIRIAEALSRLTAIGLTSGIGRQNGALKAILK